MVDTSGKYPEIDAVLSDESEGCIVCADCLDVLRELPDGCVDAVVTDPPYGIEWVPRINHTGDDHVWIDDKQFDPRPFMRLSNKHMFFGANYFAHLLPPSGDWLTWVKRPVDCNFNNDRRTYSTIELAWTDFGCKSRHFVHVWDGGMRAGDSFNRTFCHPSQKPIELFDWAVALCDAATILDPFCGSGTTCVAAKKLGRRWIGIDISERYCQIARNRLRDTPKSLFAEQPSENSKRDTEAELFKP